MMHPEDKTMAVNITITIGSLLGLTFVLIFVANFIA